jgi:transposase InsO family protein
MQVKEYIDMRLRAVLDFLENRKRTREICYACGISERNFRRWVQAYKRSGVEGLRAKSRRPYSSPNQTEVKVVEKILEVKQAKPVWGARRIAFWLLDKHNIKLHWTTVHDYIKANGLLVRIKPKPQPCKRFQRRHVDSLWQGDIFEFRIRGIGKVYVFDWLDDCSRHVHASAYLRQTAGKARASLRAAIKDRGRRPEKIYLDNGRQFRSSKFETFCAERDIQIIYGRPYNPRARGKIEAWHKILNRELISQITFSSLHHFRRELRTFVRSYNTKRRHGGIGWQTPASRYFDKMLIKTTAK